MEISLSISLLLSVLLCSPPALAQPRDWSESVASRSLVSTGDLARLERVLAKARRGKTVIVGAIGGSITKPLCRSARRPIRRGQPRRFRLAQAHPVQGLARPAVRPAAAWDIQILPPSAPRLDAAPDGTAVRTSPLVEEDGSSHLSPYREWAAAKGGPTRGTPECCSHYLVFPTELALSIRPVIRFARSRLDVA